jgi:hypothetical protein
MMNTVWYFFCAAAFANGNLSDHTSLQNTLVQLEVSHPTELTKVAILETGWQLTEGVGRYNNLFGMRCHSRWTQCGCTLSGYAVYQTPYLSIIDMLLWWEKDPILEEENPYQFMQRRNYNTDSSYFYYLSQINVSN